MGKALQNTSWPSITISSDGKNLINKFFQLVDVPDKSSGRQLAEEVFTEDGVMVIATGKIIGSEAISKSREHAWDVISSRHHEVIKVYASDAEGSDVLLIGKLVAAVKSGNKVEVGFTARIVMEMTIEGLRMKLYEVWSDSAPIKDLLQQA